MIWSFVPRHPFVTFAWVCQSVFIFSVSLSDVHCSSSVFNLTNFSVAMISLTNVVVLVRVFIAAMKQKMEKKNGVKQLGEERVRFLFLKEVRRGT